METFGKRIKSARKTRQMNQTVLAEKAGIKQPTLSDIETGETKMLEASTLVSISQALNVRPEWIMTGKLPIEANIAPLGDDRLLQQLIDFYGLLCDSKKHELARYANYLATHEIDQPSPANPYPAAQRESASHRSTVKHK